ncbi:hypothetical protein V6N11_005143 [Hibiscus sabdariffa]|uniref:BURP domain-containing protein n=1 Tax=Hibiscus sabdariffa TaxID=183260 RepID=A0ABR2RLW1_9ROSI
MAFQFLFVFALLTIVFAGSHGAVPEEVYWKSVFPNNPMPKALKDILPPLVNSGDAYSDREIDIRYYVRMYTDTFKQLIATIMPRRNHGDCDPRLYEHEYSTDRMTNRDRLRSQGKYGDGESNKLSETTFFLQRDLRIGKPVNLPSLVATSDKTAFLPDQVAKAIPFSSDKLSEILNNFSLKPQTREANLMDETIRGCERAAISGEQKFCAASLESFTDLSVTKLGKRIQLLSNELSKEANNTLFTIARGMQNMGENELVCHKMEYPGAVFLCHSIDKTTVYKVPLVGRDGTTANALAVCHKDTSSWSPKHMAFRFKFSKLSLEPSPFVTSLPEIPLSGFPTEQPIDVSNKETLFLSGSEGGEEWTRVCSQSEMQHELVSIVDAFEQLGLNVLFRQEFVAIISLPWKPLLWIKTNKLQISKMLPKLFLRPSKREEERGCL